MRVGIVSVGKSYHHFSDWYRADRYLLRMLLERGYEVSLLELGPWQDSEIAGKVVKNFWLEHQALIVFCPCDRPSFEFAIDLVRLGEILPPGICDGLHAVLSCAGLGTPRLSSLPNPSVGDIEVAFDSNRKPVCVCIRIPGTGQDARVGYGRIVFLGHDAPQSFATVADFVLSRLRTSPITPSPVITIGFATLLDSEQQDDLKSVLRSFEKEGIRFKFVHGIAGSRLCILGTDVSVEQIQGELYRTLREKGLPVLPLGTNSIEEAVVRVLTERQQTLATAESCTGGLISHRITNVPGASAVYVGGVVAYSNRLKEELLGVVPETLAKRGAVSAETAEEMVLGLKKRLKADYAISVTGIAGPTGGSPAKPVGTVYVGLATPKNVHVQKLYNPLEREIFKLWVSQKVLELLWKSFQER